jgi:1,4-alpha-glucan branching enzyme
MVDLLRRFADEGKQDMLTLGVTPVLAAQLDDPYCLREFHSWLGNWQLRAQEASTLWRGDPLKRDLAADEYQAATRAVEELETRWRHGQSSCSAAR